MEVLYHIDDRKWPPGPFYVQFQDDLIEITKASLRRAMREQGHEYVRFVFWVQDPLDPGRHILRGWGRSERTLSNYVDGLLERSK